MDFHQRAVRCTFVPAGVGEARPAWLQLQVNTGAVAAAVDFVVFAVIRPSAHHPGYRERERVVYSRGKPNTCV